jgi:hypothetical protein
MSLHSTTTQKTAILIVTTLRTSSHSCSIVRRVKTFAAQTVIHVLKSIAGDTFYKYQIMVTLKKTNHFYSVWGLYLPCQTCFGPTGSSSVVTFTMFGADVQGYIVKIFESVNYIINIADKTLLKILKSFFKRLVKTSIMHCKLRCHFEHFFHCGTWSTIQLYQLWRLNSLSSLLPLLHL